MEEITLKKKRSVWRLLIENRAIWGTIIFWVYNLTFLAFIGFGFGPIVLPSVIQGVRVGMIPGFYAAFGAILVSIPLITAILGITVFRKDTGKLFLLGYGIEGPLMLVLAVRFFGLGQTTLAVKIIMTVAIIGMITLLWHLLDPEPFDRKGWQGVVKAIGLACLIAIGFYASIWVLFYAVPLGRFFLEGIGEFFRNIPEFFGYLRRDLVDALAEGFRFLLFLVFGGLLFVFTGTLFILLPLIVPWLYIKTWWQGNQGIGRLPAFGVLTVVFALIGLGLFAVDRQPQAEAFALLESNPATIREARDILNQSDQIRAGLLNSYLARTRYLSAQNELDHIRWMYEDAFDLAAEVSLRVQGRYEIVARPFLYHPVNPIEPAATANQRWQQGSSLTTEPEQAAELYEKFFDEPINEGEKEEVVRAVRTTWDPTQAQAAWQAVDDREVLLEEQTLNHTDLGDGVHGFELHEVYSNQTATRQEVVYYFSLPETAVITGVWLGDEEGKQFDYRVAPRGAAQQVYQEQVQRQVDPALVEQIGPSQYRLRIFPIEPVRQRWESNDTLTPTIEP
ncbi:MAG: TIGR02921 family PEP-CTERM protein, partial [Anaerolineae bacterium]